MYRILIPWGISGVRRSIFKTGRKAASVFPVAVGEIRRTFFPSKIWGMAFSCGSVGESNSLFSINLRTGLANMLKTFSAVSVKANLPFGSREYTTEGGVKAFWKLKKIQDLDLWEEAFSAL